MVDVPRTSTAIRRRVELGETVMRAPLQFAVLENEFLQTHCSGCLLNVAERAKKVAKAETVVKREYLTCQRCQSVVYCSVVSCFWRVNKELMDRGAVPKARMNTSQNVGRSAHVRPRLRRKFAY